MKKIIRINMSKDVPEVVEEAMGRYEGLGGRGLTSGIVSSEVEPLCHPLGEENKFVIAPGLLGGTASAMSGRLSVGCKSPLTGGIKESNAGGQPGQALARLGIGAVVIEGKPRGGDLYKIEVSKSGVRVVKDNSLKMLTNYELIERLRKDYGDKIAVMSVGPAGEMRLSGASVACTDMELRPTRHCGRGGVGAVMGSKGVKAIIIDESETKALEPRDPEGFRDANRRFVLGLQRHPVTGQGLPAYGTNVLTNIINEVGAYPTYNFREGQFAGARRISGEVEAEIEKERGGNPTHGCHRGCVIRCSGIYHDKDGHYLTKQPEYETVWAFGGNCGIDDLDKIAMMDFLCDDIGLDTIEMGVAIGVLMEAGLIKWGDADSAISLLKEIRVGNPMGRIIGNGAEYTGRAFGVDKVPVVKGQGLPAYDPRAVQGIGVTYATSPMGADHTAGYSIATNVLKSGGFVDPLKPEGQIELSRSLQIATAFIDSTGMCLFVAMAMMDQPETYQALLDLINSFYGWNMKESDVVEYGKRILKMERDFNIRAGFTSKKDRLPMFFYKDPLPPHNKVFMVKDEDLDKVFDW
ncbi:MAG: aldehyde ferredoxin oxidoreductase [Proteobacteria bacterium]|nr:aldehyde ferredoxin oxidoreductase [Pseudomonadota bacterium]